MGANCKNNYYGTSYVNVLPSGAGRDKAADAGDDSGYKEYIQHGDDAAPFPSL